jgi:c-di-GMP-binding flagellar brake protein YcgR
MDNAERVTGQNLINMIETLKKEKTIIKLLIPGAGIEGLSIVVGIKTGDSQPGFIIDFPAGVGIGIFYAQGSRIVIEFNDREKINYRLRSVIASVTKQQIFIAIPEFIQRLQRRNFFRIVSPIGTRVIINDGNKKYELDVIDISEGGALISHPVKYHDENKFFKGAVTPLLILHKNGNSIQSIKVNKAEIIRAGKVVETGNFNYALKFLDYDKKDADILRNFIYSCQRRMIQKKRFQEDE